MKYFVAFLVISALVLLAHGIPADTPPSAGGADPSKLASAATGGAGVAAAAGVAVGSAKQAQNMASTAEGKVTNGISSAIKDVGKVGKDIIDDITNIFG